MSIQSSTVSKSERGSLAFAHAGNGDMNVSLGLAIDLSTFESFARTNDIRVEAMNRFFDTVVQKEIPLERIDDTLREIADTHLRTRTELSIFRPHGEAGQLQIAAAEAFERGEIEKTEELLAQVELLAEANSEAAQLALRNSAREQAQARALRANLQLMRLDYASAAKTFRDAATLLVANDPYSATYLTNSASAECKAGHFTAAIEVANAALDVVEGLSESELAKVYRARSQAQRELAQYDQALLDNSIAREAAEKAKDIQLINEIGIETVGLLIDLGRIVEAEEAIENIRDRSAELSTSSKSQLARRFHTLGRLRIEQAQWIAAESVLTKALSLREDELAMDHPELIRNRCDLAYVWLHSDRVHDAVELYETAQTSFLNVFGTEHPDYVTILDHLAGAYSTIGNNHSAIRAYENALDLGARSLGEDHPDLGQSWNNLGLVRQRTSDLEGARTAFRNAVRVFEKSLGKTHIDTATAWHNLSGVLLRLGYGEEAKLLCDKALTCRSSVLGPDHPIVSDSLRQRALLHNHSGDLSAAIENQEAAVALLENNPNSKASDRAQALAELSKYSLSLGQHRAALTSARASLFIARRLAGPKNELLGLVLNNLGHAVLANGQPLRAKRLLEASLVMRRDNNGGTDAELPTVLVNLASVCLVTGNPDRAEALLIEAITYGDQLWPNGSTLLAVALNNLARLRETSGNANSAGRLYNRSVQLMDSLLGPEHPDTRAIRKNMQTWEKSKSAT